MACAAAAARCELAHRDVARHAERTCLKNCESLLAGTPSRALDLGLLTCELELGIPVVLLVAGRQLNEPFSLIDHSIFCGITTYNSFKLTEVEVKKLFRVFVKFTPRVLPASIRNLFCQ